MAQVLKPRRSRVFFYVQVVVVFGLVLALVVLSGCAWIKPNPDVVNTTTPVLVRPEPPADLIQRYQPDDIPDWVAPDDPSASSCLTQEGEDQQRKNMQNEQRLRKRSRIYASGGLI